MTKQLKISGISLMSTLFLSSIFMFSTGSVVGQEEDPIKIRQASMKTVGAASKTLGQMIKGEKDYNAEEAQQAMTDMRDALIVFVENFPEGSDEGETEASPNIWLDMEGFIEASKKMETEANDAIAIVGEGLDGLKAGFGSVSKNCKGCHQNYREKKF